jgi:energy-coupling factor transport system permease protein
METKGFSHSLGDERSRALRTEGMMLRTRDVSFVFGSLLFVAAVWVVT